MTWMKFIKILPIAKELGIEQGKLYNNSRGLYSSLTPKDRDKIANLIKPAIEELFQMLGWYAVIGKPKKD